MFKLVVKQVISSLPAGGAMNLYEYGHLDLFRSGVLSSVWSLGQTDIYGWVNNSFYSHGETSNCHAAMDTPISEISSSSQYNIKKAFRLD